MPAVEWWVSGQLLLDIMELQRHGVYALAVKGVGREKIVQVESVMANYDHSIFAQSDVLLIQLPFAQLPLDKDNRVRHVHGEG